MTLGGRKGVAYNIFSHFLSWVRIAHCQENELHYRGRIKEQCAVCMFKSSAVNLSAVLGDINVCVLMLALVG